MQWVLMAPHPIGSPLDNGFVHIVRPFPPPEEGPPCLSHGSQWVAPFICGWGPLKPHLQRISKITVCSRKPATQSSHGRFVEDPCKTILQGMGLLMQSAIKSVIACRDRDFLYQTPQKALKGDILKGDILNLMFRKGVGGGGWRQTDPQKEPQKFSRNVSPFS